MENKFIKNEELKEEFTDERTGISYTLKGDYYIPNLVIEQEKKVPLNKYGRARLKYLKEHNKVEYSILFTKGELYKHLDEVQTTAQERLDYLINEMKKKENLTEEMKNTDHFRWVGTMNSIKESAEEIIYKELIYV